MNQKGFAPILIAIGVLLVIGIVAGVYYFGISKNAKPYSQNPVVITQTPTSSIPKSPVSLDTSNWQTYTNSKYGYEFNLPLNWWRVDPPPYYPDSKIDYQYFEPSKAFFCGGAATHILIEVVDNKNNLSSNDFAKQLINDYIKKYGDIYKQVSILSNRMGFSNDLDITIAEGFPGAGSPGPSAYINDKRGHIIEISTEPEHGINPETFPLDQIFSTFKLINPSPNISEVKVDIVEKNILDGDIEVINGVNKKVITDWGYNSQPILSPDKTKVAYISETKESVTKRNYNNDKSQTSNNVWIINIDGTNPTQVTKQFDNVFRSNLHWLDNNRLIFTDGDESVKVYSLKNNTTQTILGSDEPVANNLNNRVIYLYNSNYSYLLKFGAEINIIDLLNLKATKVTDSITPTSCDFRFGPDNKTFIGDKDAKTPDIKAILDLTTGRVNYKKK